MALLTFPPSPFDGQIYPSPAAPGDHVYRWSSLEQTWQLLGYATGVAGGTYGSSTVIPRFTVDAVGTLTFAENVSISLATTLATGVVQIGNNINVDVAGIISVNDATLTQKGVVQLVNTTAGDCDSGKALTAAAGCNLQTQITALAARVTALENSGLENLDNISPLFDGVTTTFQMGVGGVSFSPTPITNLVIILGGVVQSSPSAYTVVGDYIVFTEAPLAGTTFNGLTVLAS